MRLYLLRHADADTLAPNDDDRVLSAKGEEQARRVGRFCREMDLQPELILSSPLPRALQTAQAVATACKGTVKAVPWLACGMTPTLGLEELKIFRGSQSVMIVGHEPDFSALAAHLLGLPSATLIHIRKASLTALQVDLLRPGTARLEFSIPCRLMP